MSSVMPDTATPFGARVAQRLADDQIIWLTSVDANGMPQPNPVWFLWDGETFLIYNRTEAKRLVHIQRNPRVSLHFNSDSHGGDIAIITGEAHLSVDPPPDQVPAYMEKYNALIASIFQTAANFGSQYPLTLRITPHRVRGF